jgi:acetyl-CoA acyltransferase
MTKQLQDAYIVAATRTPIGKAPRGMFKNTRPDDLLVRVMQSALAQVPGLDPKLIEDAIIGCSFPEGAQGLNMARNAVLLAGLPNTIGGVTINRYCASGITAVAMAADRIRVGQADVMFAGGAESMSMVPMMGFHPSVNMDVFKDENIGMAYGMGLTGERVAQQWKVSREAQDAFALESHRRALAAQAAGEFNDERPGQAEGSVCRQRHGHCGQLLANFGWRRCADPGQRKDPEAVQPDAAGAFRLVCSARRTAGNHGYRS